jgi:translation initiation factor IF-1
VAAVPLPQGEKGWVLRLFQQIRGERYSLEGVCQCGHAALFNERSRFKLNIEDYVVKCARCPRWYRPHKIMLQKKDVVVEGLCFYPYEERSDRLKHWLLKAGTFNPESLLKTNAALYATIVLLDLSVHHGFARAYIPATRYREVLPDSEKKIINFRGKLKTSVLAHALGVDREVIIQLVQKPPVEVVN